MRCSIFKLKGVIITRSVKKFWNFILKWIVYPYIQNIILIVLNLGLYYEYKNSMLFVIILVIFIFNLLRNSRENKLKSQMSYLSYRPILTSYNGWYDTGQIKEHAGVLWRIFRHDNMDYWGDKHPQPEDYEVKVTPICPSCRTELKESASLLARWGRGGYVWECVECKFKKENKNSFLLESEDAKTKVRGDVIRSRKKNNN